VNSLAAAISITWPADDRQLSLIRLSRTVVSGFPGQLGGVKLEESR
jgi:hypothetical protein